MGEIKNVCKEIDDKYLKKNERTKKDKILYYSLGNKLMNGLNFSEEKITKEELDILIDLTKRVCKKENNISKYLEKDILKAIVWYTDEFIEKMLTEGRRRIILNKDTLNSVQDNEDKVELEKSINLMNLAYELIQITKNRDSFSGARKGYSTRILTSLNKRYKIIGLEELYISNFKFRSLDLLNDTLDSIKIYSKDSETVMSEKIIELIGKRVKKAKKRSELVSCLQALIELNEIGELEAMDRVSEWKEKNLY